MVLLVQTCWMVITELKMAAEAFASLGQAGQVVVLTFTLAGTSTFSKTKCTDFICKDLILMPLPTEHLPTFRIAIAAMDVDFELSQQLQGHGNQAWRSMLVVQCLFVIVFDLFHHHR